MINHLEKIVVSTFISLFVLGCAHDGASDRRVLDEFSGFVCPASGYVKYESWGKNGLSKFCVDIGTKLRDGSFVASENGRIRVSGFYDHGNKVGTWYSYGKNGAKYAHEATEKNE